MVEWGRPRKSGSQEGGMCEVGGEKDEEEKWTNKEGDGVEGGKVSSYGEKYSNF